jgi:hypothetical protein
VQVCNRWQSKWFRLAVSGKKGSARYNRTVARRALEDEEDRAVLGRPGPSRRTRSPPPAHAASRPARVAYYPEVIRKGGPRKGVGKGKSNNFELRRRDPASRKLIGPRPRFNLLGAPAAAQLSTDDDVRSYDSGAYLLSDDDTGSCDDDRRYPGFEAKPMLCLRRYQRSLAELHRYKSELEWLLQKEKPTRGLRRLIRSHRRNFHRLTKLVGYWKEDMEAECKVNESFVVGATSSDDGRREVMEDDESQEVDTE